MSKTKNLAKKLGVISKGKIKETLQTTAKSQPFSYICVIDFEATCWSEKKLHRTQEIIEFPAVLLNIATGAVEEEFQWFIQPQENTTLSGFCTQLTGISQAQVDNGIPLPVCLRLFDEWVTKIEKERDILFLRPLPINKHLLKQEHARKELVAMATWSDWDLGVALHYECRRKRVRKASYFSQWIDLRAVYKSFYDRKPAGLNGALSDLGLSFKGREHSGIDDARNTARLCRRMVCDGCVLRVTQSLPKDKKGATVKSAPEAGSHLSCPTTVSSADAQPSCNTAEKVVGSYPLTVSDTGCSLRVDGREPGAEEEMNESLTSAEDRQFLSSIAGQLDFVELSHKQAMPTAEDSSMVENFKKPHSIPCKNQPSLSSPRGPLSPKAVNITLHHNISTQPGAVKWTTPLSAMSPSSTCVQTVAISPGRSTLGRCRVMGPASLPVQDGRMPLPLAVTPPPCWRRRGEECCTSTAGPNEGRSLCASRERNVVGSASERTAC